jgi:hypothetical protein
VDTEPSSELLEHPGTTGAIMSQQSDSDNEIILLETAPSEIEGMMWADAIRAEGISVMLKPGGPGAGAWASSATFEHALYVREENFDAAQAILERFLSGGGERSSAVRGRRAAPRVQPRSLRKPG